MAVGIAELIILGLLADWLFRSVKVPGLVGMLLLGVAVGPHALNAVSPGIFPVAADLRLIALVVILLRSGLEISRQVLFRVGRRAVLMSFVPCLLEIGAVTLVAPMLLGVTRLEAAILGSVLAAVSPAVVVPLMVRFIEERRGAERGMPTLILAGASMDDAVAIVLCSGLVGVYAGTAEGAWIWQIATVPLSVVLGLAAGLAVGWLVCRWFDRFNPRATKRVMVLLGISVLFSQAGHAGASAVPFAGLVAVMAMGFIILEEREHAAHELSGRLAKVWIFAQVLLFTLVGAQVDLAVAARAGLMGLAVIAGGLAGRSVGVQLCLLGSEFTRRERVFAGFAYVPKATVQAAIGAVPLAAMRAAGMPEGPGELILAMAVLSILATAPAGAWLITWAGEHLLDPAPPDAPDPAFEAAVESHEAD